MIVDYVTTVCLINVHYTRDRERKVHVDWV